MQEVNGFKFNETYGKWEKIVDMKVVSVQSVLTTHRKDGSPIEGKPYYLAVAEYNGQRTSAVVYEANIANIEVGKTVSASVSFTDGNETPWISLLGGAPRATAEMFDFDFQAALAAQGVGAEQIGD